MTKQLAYRLIRYAASWETLLHVLLMYFNRDIDSNYHVRQ